VYSLTILDNQSGCVRASSSMKAQISPPAAAIPMFLDMDRFLSGQRQYFKDPPNSWQIVSVSSVDGPFTTTTSNDLCFR
jgi:hypothetical protein